jgi:hypothetical protein
MVRRDKRAYQFPAFAVQNIERTTGIEGNNLHGNQDYTPYEPGNYLFSYISNSARYRDQKVKEDKYWKDLMPLLEVEIPNTIKKIEPLNRSSREWMLIGLMESKFINIIGHTPSVKSMMDAGYFPTTHTYIWLALDLLKVYREMLLNCFASIDGFINGLQNMQPGVRFPSDLKSVS